ncbi:Sir2 family histone deacetylase Hst4 [Schizosaccharomyces cryophilus OY26]|uniref:Sir2 family histone deacetylase Hst4 n=1 Tax=Schizosaccharomyces cryophilus (strain OY26 / ATCC MYA-4695 / CBS 11777 / NBRC 106824 / NRRL Y48691) TaxID=653667 RepID=S9X3U5_SCHCR|nr:Sir2 family histone deacetylase Hst4 [Schizosaccharomyces cryophilus OY26]EPY51772.1 Sir2 family histone deacetylase Hst4 [Schizosaccharomyces cryophilus OY26]
MKPDELLPINDESKKRKLQSTETGLKSHEQIADSPIKIQLSSDNVDLNPAIAALRKAKRIVIVTGAGISCGAGIPDFRSSVGLFSSLRSEYKLNCSGKELFDGGVYRDLKSVNVFHEMIKKLHELSDNAAPTDFHHFLSKLAQDSKLLRLYTQNIDFLETRLEGLQTCTPLPQTAPWPTTIPLHGTLEVVRCTRCPFVRPFHPGLFEKDGLTACPECRTENEVRRIAGKRLVMEGCLRPRIVLYNEGHPDSDAIGAVCSQDLKSRPDCLVIAGTSCKIPGVKRIIKEMSNCVHRQKGSVIWLNFDSPTKEFSNLCDIIVEGDCQAAIRTMKPYLEAPRWRPKAHSNTSLAAKKRTSGQAKLTASTKVTKPQSPSKKVKKERSPLESINRVMESVQLPEAGVKREVEYSEFPKHS